MCMKGIRASGKSLALTQPPPSVIGIKPYHSASATVQSPMLDRVSAASSQGQQGAKKQSSDSGISTLGRRSSTQELSHRASQVLHRRFQATLAGTAISEAPTEGPVSCSGAAEPAEAGKGASASSEDVARPVGEAGAAASVSESAAASSASASAEARQGHAADRESGQIPQQTHAEEENGGVGSDSTFRTEPSRGSSPQGSKVVHRKGMSVGRTQGIQAEDGVNLMAAMDDMWLGSHAEPYSRSTIG